MLKLYCQKCGGLNAYVSQKPNFCQKCGTGFGQNTADAALQEEDDEEAEQQERIPDINDINIEDLVEIESRIYRGEKLGDIVCTSDGKAFEGVNTPNENYSIEDFQKEAGYTKSNNEEKPET